MQRVGELAQADPASVEERIEGNETLGDAYIEAGEKAVRTSDAVFRDGLAQLIAAGLRDTARIDEVAFYTSVLAQLEPIHLRFLAATHRAQQPDADRPQGLKNITVRYVAVQTAMPPEIASSVAERLHSLSLLTDRLDGEMVSWSQETLGAFGLTDAGRALLTHCEQFDIGSPKTEPPKPT